MTTSHELQSLQPCTVNADQFIAYVRDPTADPDFVRHVTACRYCQVRLLSMSAVDRQACQDFLAQLPEFAEAEAADQAMLDRFAALQLHLVWCRDCFRFYRELVKMNQLAHEDILPVSAHEAYRPPDLSFLHTPVAWVTGQVSAAGTKLLGTLRLNLGPLFQPPTPVLELARKAGATEPAPFAANELATISLGSEQLGTLDVEVRLYADDGNRLLRRLEVYAWGTDRPDMAHDGTRVLLRLLDGKEIERVTDESGLVAFAGLPETELLASVLEITPVA